VEKKKLSLERDRQNTYGESPHGARKPPPNSPLQRTRTSVPAGLTERFLWMFIRVRNWPRARTRETFARRPCSRQIPCVVSFLRASARHIAAGFRVSRRTLSRHWCGRQVAHRGGTQRCLASDFVGGHSNEI